MANTEIIKRLKRDLFNDEMPFAERASLLWHYQVRQNPQIAEYAAALGTQEPASLPIAFFKKFSLKCGSWEPEAVFKSSGTTGQIPSRHLVRDLNWYQEIVLKGFFSFFPKRNYRILALLPHYLERGNSSLVQMVRFWIDAFGLPGSGFFLRDHQALERAIRDAGKAGEPVLLIGVAYALLDYAQEGRPPLPPYSTVIETGGMKGRKKELTRSALHQELRNGLGVEHIFSEYGMTELMSQAYTGKEGRFHAPPWMGIRISDIHLDRLDQPLGTTGRLHIIDLANIHTCGFIATDDLGRLHSDGSFEVLGRLDTAEMRGCNLMYV